MARNRSEKSPSGDPMVDEAIRAWLRLALSQRRGDERARRRRFDRLEIDAYERLDRHQRQLRWQMMTDGLGDNETENVIALFGHEPEFQDGAQSK